MKADHCYMCDEFQRMLDESESTIASQQAALDAYKNATHQIINFSMEFDEDCSDFDEGFIGGLEEAEILIRNALAKAEAQEGDQL